MKKLIFILGLLSTVYGQIWTPVNGNYRYVSRLGLPVHDTTGSFSLQDSAQVIIRPQDSTVYMRYKGKWQKVGGVSTSTDSTIFATILNARRIADSAAAAVVVPAQFNLSTNAPIKKSGTYPNLTVYADTSTNQITSLSTLGTARRIADSAANAVPIGNYKLNSDSILNTGYSSIFAKNKSRDSIVSLLSNYTPTSRTLTINGTTFDLTTNRTWNVGTVTSINSGYGLTGGTITNTGTQGVDSLLLLTKAMAGATYIPLSQKSANNGVASLDAGGKVPVSQLPSSLMIYKGIWDAGSNTPTLNNSIGVAGWVYQISNYGSGSYFGVLDTFYVGDYLMYNGTSWEVSSNTNTVRSVNGQQGVVSLSTSNITEGTNYYWNQTRFNNAFTLKSTDNLTEGSVNMYFTNTRVNTQVATYTGDVTLTGTAYAIGSGKVTNAMLAGTINYSKMDGTTVPTWNQNTTGTAAIATSWGGYAANFTAGDGTNAYNLIGYDGTAGIVKTYGATYLKTWLGLGSAAYSTTGNFIQNQNASAQSADMWINGTSTISFNGSAITPLKLVDNEATYARTWNIGNNGTDGTSSFYIYDATSSIYALRIRGITGNVVTGGNLQVGSSGTGTITSGAITSTAINIAGNGASVDPYGTIAVTQPNTLSYSYYGLTRAGQIGMGMGINTSNEFFIGSTTSGNIGSVLTGTAYMRLNSASVVFNGGITGTSLSTGTGAINGNTNLSSTASPTFGGLTLTGALLGTSATFSNTVTSSSLIKSGGTSSQILAADGSVITAGSGVTISGGTISAGGGTSGTYTPTLTNTYNISASTLLSATYTQVGNIVTVSVGGWATATLAGICNLTISLPVNTSNSSQFHIGSVSINDNSGTTYSSGEGSLTSTSTIQINFRTLFAATAGFNVTFQYSL